MLLQDDVEEVHSETIVHEDMLTSSSWNLSDDTDKQYAFPPDNLNPVSADVGDTNRNSEEERNERGMVSITRCFHF